MGSSSEPSGPSVMTISCPLGSPRTGRGLEGKAERAVFSGENLRRAARCTYCFMCIFSFTPHVSFTAPPDEYDYNHAANEGREAEKDYLASPGHPVWWSQSFRSELALCRSWDLDNVARRSPCLGCGKKAIALALLSTESEALYKEANVDNSQLFRAREAGPARLLHPCWLGRSKCHY